MSDVELGSPRVAGAFVFVLRMRDGVAFRLRAELVGTAGPLELRILLEDGYRWAAGLGVVLELPDGSLSLLFGGLRGVFISTLLVVVAVAEASDIGGEGGVRVSVTEAPVDVVLDPRGVIIIGDETLELGEPIEGELGAEMSVWIAASCRFRSLSCIISASILRSDSSSRSRCVSIRNPSRSCSPIFISSSIMTARSIATLYFDSRSSYDEDVFRACRSKSSFWTSISRSFSCKVLLESRSVVISFCRVLCAAPASIFDCLHLVYCILDSERAAKGNSIYLPLLNLETKRFRLFLQRSFPCFCCLYILL